MLVPAISLAIVQLAGDNVAVVPDLASVIGPNIYLTIIVAYILLGSLLTGLSAWIGVQTGQELMIVVKKLLGCPGKNAIAMIILAISIPASAITGGYFAGWVLHILTGIPHPIAIPICLLLFSLVAVGYGYEFLKLSHYMALLLVPILVLLYAQHGSIDILWQVDVSTINWSLVFALIGYNAGGMRPVLIVETAALLSNKGDKAVMLVVTAKIFEGLLTLAMAQVVLFSGASGPLALSQVALDSFGTAGAYAFNLILLCTFLNTMAPAMVVNARQIGILSNLSLWPSVGIAITLVYAVSLAPIKTLLAAMSITGVFTISFLFYVAFLLHKQPINKS